MWSWQVAVPSSGPWGRPLIIIEHEPQMPSRQSWSNATGSSPLAIEPLVEHVEQLEERHVLADVVDLVGLEPAGRLGPAWRQTLSVTFMFRTCFVEIR